MPRSYRRAVVAFLTLASVAISGCASIQVVHETPHGGVVDLRGPTEQARAKAEEHMRSQCPFGYRIVEDQERSIAYACKAPDASPAPAKRETYVGI